MDRVVRALARQYSIEPTDENAHRLANTVTRAVEDDPPVKILVSRGFGAGWSTWNMGDEEYMRLLLTFPPLVAAVERQEDIDAEHPAYLALLDELEARGYEDEPYAGGLRGLYVQEVSGPFIISDYDGSESVTTLAGFLKRATIL